MMDASPAGGSWATSSSHHAQDHSHAQSQAFGDDDDNAGGKKKKGNKRRKVNHACLYCRRSHMTCDEGRPCQRCIKREIGHLCHDEPKQGSSGPTSNLTNSLATPPPSASSSTSNIGRLTNPPQLPGSVPPILEVLNSFPAQPPPPYAPTHAPPATDASTPNANTRTSILSPSRSKPARYRSYEWTHSAPTRTPIVPMSKQEAFLLTAADQPGGTRDERLARVIRSKYEAGLLKPYNYVHGYARLSRWMDRNLRPDSKQLILQPLQILRPKFSAIAKGLTDMDLVFIEEAFERMLLDYDRVFSAMGIPACLWRRTGEIYKGNKEFAELVGIDDGMLREGRLCIYELMAEDAAVNYWEKYGNVAFDTGQKAVLTTCTLRYKPDDQNRTESGLVQCCFSFTIRRDSWGIPSMIVGNFIRL
ncbi:hypothetical protein SISNIDRAFT_476133 [Sistotremastrum niveocremeum HHB9708]|uniref:Zn(2)-C6 fungal-type domain-containing protein n=1 Tax=Sistotremastrum niveocremeum HHB9708 TaxID=1314777 RepID=A0A164NTK4_9AGAM|nr:hypothetical protein SISNIDRAFT_476133 [Sistotremastrum niveocremeum HHB9708]